VDVLRQLVVFIGAQNRSADVKTAIATLAECQDPAVVFPLVGGLGEGLKRAGTSLLAADSTGRIKAWLRRAPEIARDAARPEQLRRAAIEALAHVPYDEAAPGLLAVLASKPRTALQLAAIGTLDQFRDPQVGPALLARYTELDPEGRARAIAALLGRPERIDSLWTGLGRDIIDTGEVSAAQVNSLRKHRSERVRERALRFFGAANPAARRDVYRELLPALQLAGDPVRGKVHFEARCAACHRYGGIGFEFGPDLSGTRTGGKEKLLTSIVDPNRDVPAQFMVHTVETKDGETVGGILKDETATTVSLRLPGGGERTLPVANIATRKTLTQSIMPEGLDAGMSRQEMADLIEFILNPGSQIPRSPTHHGGTGSDASNN
jgi:putative heme-binding domain-containing protein